MEIIQGRHLFVRVADILCDLTQSSSSIYTGNS